MEEPLPLHDLYHAGGILSSDPSKSFPNPKRSWSRHRDVFSSGVRCMIVGLAGNEIHQRRYSFRTERSQLEAYIEESNRDFYLNHGENGGDPETSNQASSDEPRPYANRPVTAGLAARRAGCLSGGFTCPGAAEDFLLQRKPSGGVLTPSTAFKRLASDP